MNIKNIQLKHGIFLAPMAGAADAAFRLICRSYGAEYVVTEMVSAKAVVFRDKKTRALARLEPDEYPAAVQLFGSDPGIMGEAARIIADLHAPSAIDINMGCPVPKIAGGGDGSALMREPLKAGAVIESVVKAVDIPVTVKIRKGWSADEANAVEIARIAEDSGAAAVAVHGRTRDQFYTGASDRAVIAEVKRAVGIPVIGNGDIASGEDALSMLRETGCDGVMAGRGALGNPWLFSGIKSALEGKTPPEPTPAERCAAAERHLALAVERKGGRVAVLELRKHMSWYIRGIPGAAALRSRVNTAESPGEMLAIIREAFLHE